MSARTAVMAVARWTVAEHLRARLRESNDKPERHLGTPTMGEANPPDLEYCLALAFVNFSAVTLYIALIRSMYV